MKFKGGINMAIRWNQEDVMKKLKKQKEEEESGQTDKRMWTPTTPKKGKSVYRVRPLPDMTSGGEAWVKRFQHGFQAPSGSWFIENCPTTMGNKCPVEDYLNKQNLFNNGDPKDKNFASKVYKKKNYFMNILVIKDDRSDGENEGKVFIWRFGQKIYEKISSALFPEPGMEQIMFLDPYKGRDFLISTKMVKDGDKDYPNYDESVFAQTPSAIADTDEAINKILESCFDLKTELLAPKYFKTYEEFEKMFKANVIDYRSGERKEEKKVEEKKEEKKEDKKIEEKLVEPKKEDVPVKETPVVEEVNDDEFLASLNKELKHLQGEKTK